MSLQLVSAYSAIQWFFEMDELLAFSWVTRRLTWVSALPSGGLRRLSGYTEDNLDLRSAQKCKI